MKVLSSFPPSSAGHLSLHTTVVGACSSLLPCFHVCLKAEVSTALTGDPARTHARALAPPPSWFWSLSWPQVYDWLAGAKLVVPPSHYMSREEAMYSFPKLRENVRLEVPPPPLLTSRKRCDEINYVRIYGMRGI